MAIEVHFSAVFCCVIVIRFTIMPVGIFHWRPIGPFKTCTENITWELKSYELLQISELQWLSLLLRGNLVLIPEIWNDNKQRIFGFTYLHWYVISTEYRKENPHDSNPTQVACGSFLAGLWKAPSKQCLSHIRVWVKQTNNYLSAVQLLHQLKQQKSCFSIVCNVSNGSLIQERNSQIKSKTKRSFTI